MDKKINVLKYKPSKVSKIIHIGDVHIRQLRRHAEYREQFAKLYSMIDNIKEENDIIVLTGDIVHTKTDMSPELIQLTSEFFRELATRLPVILIPGNHDANLNNADRLDALSPIVSNLNLDNFYYLKDTNLYRYNNLVFSAMSMFDDKKEYIRAKDIDSSLTKIALYHGVVTNATISSGYVLESNISVKFFDGFDYVLLGDIHNFSYLNEEKTIAYPGSLIQQNYGESYNNHGFLVWDLRSKTSEFYPIDNDYGYHTLLMDNGKILTYDISKITKHSRVRLKVCNTPDNIIRETVDKIKVKFGVPEVNTVRVDTILPNHTVNLHRLNDLDIRDVVVQNRLIHDYLNLNLNLALDAPLLKKIYDINEKTNILVSHKDETIRNITWHPKTFEWSNMFSYGENNKIDFSKLNGIYGVFGPNATGKSSLLDALCFCLFDTTSKTYKADQILNTKKKKFFCKFNFEIDGINYFIEKTGIKNHTSGRVKVLIDFYKIGPDGERTSLNGEQRRETDANIQSYIGSYEDFTLMCLSVQNSNTNFVDKSQTDRKELLAKFLDLNVFDSLYSTANIEYKKLVTLVENESIPALEEEIKLERKSLRDAKRNKIASVSNAKALKRDIASINEAIHDLNKRIYPIENIDISQCKVDKDSLIADRNIKTELLDKIESALATEKLQLTSITNKLSNYNIEEVKERYKSCSTKKILLDELKAKIDRQELIIKTKESKLAILHKHEYDPNCKYCINNEFVIDAKKTEVELIGDNAELQTLIASKTKLDSELIDWKSIYQDAMAISTLEENKKEKDLAIQKLTIDQLQLKNKIQSIRANITDVDRKIAQYYKESKLIELNKSLESQIEIEKAKLNDIQSVLDSWTQASTKWQSKIKVSENIINTLKEKIVKVRSLVEDKGAYEYYLQCVDREGISYQLISKILPKIENEINNILSNLVQFKIVLNMDGKNINSYIVYDDTYWALELSSGMERFISAMAIRIALINISTLPKPTFFAIDEGLGVLDSTNLNQIYLLFNYIREIFDFSLIISHIDIVRDMVDNTLVIENKNGFSQLQYI